MKRSFLFACLIFVTNLLGMEKENLNPNISANLEETTTSSSQTTSPVKQELLGQEATVDLSTLSGLIQFCFKELPEHKGGTQTGNQHYNINHVATFFGQNFDNFFKVLSQFANMYEYRPFNYLEKSKVSSNSKIIVMGDIHASLHALLRNLYRLYANGFLQNDYKFAPNIYLVFLGDYADRGYYGLETIYTLAKLKIANPNQVFLVRGNHESSDMALNFGFSNECLQKGARLGIQVFNDIVHNFFSKLPSSVFLGANVENDPIKWIQFVHGSVVVPGMRIENQKEQKGIVSTQEFLKQENSIQEISLTEHEQLSWGEIGAGNTCSFNQVRRAGLIVGIDLVNKYLQDNNISKICIGHFHLPGGILFFQNSSWNVRDPEALTTLNPKCLLFMNCPEGLGYADINQDAFGIWTFGTDGEWKIEPHVYNRDIYGARVSTLSNNSFWYIVPTFFTDGCFDSFAMQRNQPTSIPMPEKIGEVVTVRVLEESINQERKKAKVSLESAEGLAQTIQRQFNIEEISNKAIQNRSDDEQNKLRIYELLLDHKNKLRSIIRKISRDKTQENLDVLRNAKVNLNSTIYIAGRILNELRLMKKEVELEIRRQKLGAEDRRKVQKQRAQQRLQQMKKEQESVQQPQSTTQTQPESQAIIVN